MSTLDPGTYVRHKSIDLGIGEIVRSRETGGLLWHHVDFPQRDLSQWFGSEDLVVVASVGQRFLGDDFDDRVRPYEVRVLAEALSWANACSGELLVSHVDPLPHQMLLTHRVVTGEPVRKLIADDVGLGKTIETGMILSALRCRSRAQRVLIVVPAGLIVQWMEEMEEKFSIALTPLTSGTLPTTSLQWENIRYAIASIDSLKSETGLESLRHSGPWDVVVFDEAHRLSRTSEAVAQRYRLAEVILDSALCRAAILLTGTPHQGNNEKFFNLLRLVRPDLLDTWTDLQDDPTLINQLMIRNRKLDVTDAEGNRVFDPAPLVQTLPVQRDSAFLHFQKSLETYLKDGFRQVGRSVTSKVIGFVMTTYAKLASSSPRAIRGAIERRRDRLRGNLAPNCASLQTEDSRFEGETSELYGLSRCDDEGAFFAGELAQLELLADMAGACEQTDPKLHAFLKVVGGLLERKADERILVFTEYRGTQQYISQALRAHFPQCLLVEINGGMGLDQKREAVTSFNTNASLLVSTEAGGEGINLQERCHVMINYDLPWNPMRLRQRVGRLYRYGQRHQVVVFNLRTEGTADEIVLRHLQEKVDQIVQDLAGLDGDREANLMDDVLGQTIDQVPVEELVMSVHKGKSVRRVKEELDLHMDRVRVASRLQGELFGSIRGFRLEDYENVRCPFGSKDVTRFVIGAIRELGGTVREEVERPGVLVLSLPSSLAESRPQIRRDYSAVTCDRSVARRDESAEQFLFSHPAFDALIDATRSGDFECQVVRRHVAIPNPAARGMYFEFHFTVSWTALSPGSNAVREEVGVLVDMNGRIVTEEWAWQVLYGESSQKQVRWSPPREERQSAMQAAESWVNSRRSSSIENRTPQPAVLFAAALVAVS